MFLEQNQRRIGRIAIDEAHTISTWNDFRPAMDNIGVIRGLLPDVKWVSLIPFICKLSLCAKVALTATASHSVREEIKATLKMVDPITYELPSRRNNLYIDVVIQELLPDPVLHMSDFINEKLQNGGSAIIYVPTKAKAQSICAALNERQLRALEYHRDLSDEQLKENQAQWMEDKVTIMVATVAFGLGMFLDINL